MLERTFGQILFAIHQMSLAFQEKRLRQILADFELPDVLDEGICNGNGLRMIFTSQGQPALGQFQRIVP